MSDTPAHEGPSHHAVIELWTYSFPLSAGDQARLDPLASGARTELDFELRSGRTRYQGLVRERVSGAPVGGARIEGLDFDAHVAPIYARLDAVLANPRLAPLVTASEIVIDDEAFPGLQKLLSRVSDPDLARKLSPASFCSVHGDLTFENVLWHEGEITALLDVEWARPGPKDLDLDILLRCAAYPQLHVAPAFESRTHPGRRRRDPRRHQPPGSGV